MHYTVHYHLSRTIWMFSTDGNVFSKICLIIEAKVKLA